MNHRENKVLLESMTDGAPPAAFRLPRSMGERYFSHPGRVGAAVLPAMKPSGTGNSCGDALLIDLARRFFAVADSPEKNPDASFLFLRKYSGMLGELPLRTLRRAFGEGDVAADAEAIVDRTNALVKTVDYDCNTTFTGLFVFLSEGLRKALLVHCGDSILYHARAEKGTLEKLTETNHCFVGRVGRLYQTLLFDFHDDSLFLLFTDGIYDIARTARNKPYSSSEEALLNILDMGSVESICSGLAREIRTTSRRGRDDLGFIVFDPNGEPDGCEFSLLM
jgi:hypothetical protein